MQYNHDKWSGKLYEEFTMLPKHIFGVKTHTTNGYILVGVLTVIVMIVLYICNIIIYSLSY